MQSNNCLGVKHLFLLTAMHSSPLITSQGELDYELQENDNIVFISTLHGG